MISHTQEWTNTLISIAVIITSKPCHTFWPSVWGKSYNRRAYIITQQITCAVCQVERLKQLLGFKRKTKYGFPQEIRDRSKTIWLAVMENDRAKKSMIGCATGLFKLWYSLYLFWTYAILLKLLVWYWPHYTLIYWHSDRPSIYSHRESFVSYH